MKRLGIFVGLSLFFLAARAEGPSAATLRVSALQSRYAQPGDRVDVLFSSRDSHRQWQTSTLAQDIPLMALKNLPGGQAELTLSFRNPDEAARYGKEFNRTDGVYTIILRSPDERETRSLEPASYQKLFK